ncbi:3-isopropylmalate dehydratase [Pseudomonas sp. CFBP 8758]|uniref:3-isopropylmalate dehydratase n=1 Tax=Pseudomonas baltica TaxID=2762576 RepID=A0A7X1G3P8_9PSED|nr:MULTISPECIES: 3-isopropylmalate dehydratase [Pseudomonas]MBC2677109.1 3-isopropylmalate dehydratase [Pseudomonas baltica]MBD8594591.1 3-isopropylmalate dehydratase [Pseudomonas sp. CFBP 8758]MBD8602658.1 3-isopropylmalate dehydratase [Pseudomonas sp. CFBP 8771]MBD8827789.1 3-isopropylmalate dehydratase [Pseudomonas sp. CFBP 13602]
MRVFWMMLAAASLSGCTSFRADSEHLKAVPAERLSAWQQTLSPSSELVVDRDIGMLGGGCYVALLIDREPAALLAVGEVATFHLPPGEHIVGITTDKQGGLLCSKGRLNRELRLQAQPGERQHLRIVSEAKTGFGIVLDPR